MAISTAVEYPKFQISAADPCVVERQLKFRGAWKSFKEFRTPAQASAFVLEASKRRPAPLLEEESE